MNLPTSSPALRSQDSNLTGCYPDPHGMWDESRMHSSSDPWGNAPTRIQPYGCGSSINDYDVRI